MIISKKHQPLIKASKNEENKQQKKEIKKPKQTFYGAKA